MSTFNLDPSECISSFTGAFAFLSNFYPAPVEYDGVMYPTVENAYQAAKSFIPEIRARYLTLSPGKAKRMAPPKPEDWHSRSLQVMEYLVRDKFFRHKELGDKLLDTYPVQLLEGNTWGDDFFGVVLAHNSHVGYVGQNHLGRILMKVRDELRESRNGSLH